MFSSSRRLLALAAAVFIAVLTSIAIGLLSPKTPCSTRPAATSAGVGPVASADAGPIASAAQAAAAADSATCVRSAFAKVPALVGLAGVLLGGVVVLLGGAAAPAGGAGRDEGDLAAVPPRPAGRRPGDARRPGAVRRPDTVDDARGVAEADRGVLVQACIYVRDRLTSKALADRLGAALRDAGVEPVEPHGERFDAAQHEAGGTQATNDPAKVGRIAAVEIPGYADRGRPLRAPIVTVYQAAAGGRPEQEAR